MATIDSRAIVSNNCILADDVVVGPFSIIEDNVEIGEGTVIYSHSIIRSNTIIGKNNKIYQFVTLGQDTPDLKYKGEPTTLVIGDDNCIREGVTMHRGTIQDKGFTKVGSSNLIMAYAHIGHDSIIGDHCILVNNTALAGHVTVDDYSVLSGYTLIHQFCSLGKHCFTGMGSAINKDIPAFISVTGNPAKPYNINTEGLKRRGFTEEDINLLKKAYKILYRQNLETQESLALLQEMRSNALIDTLCKSIERSQRGIIR